jgi:hypothetical protein
VGWGVWGGCVLRSIGYTPGGCCPLVLVGVPVFVQVKGLLRPSIQTSFDRSVCIVDLEMVGVCFEVNWLHGWRMLLVCSGPDSHVCAG